jgi:hypothetical protein
MVFDASGLTTKILTGTGKFSQFKNVNVSHPSEEMILTIMFGELLNREGKTNSLITGTGEFNVPTS